MKSLLQYIREQEMPIKVIMRSARDDRETVMNCIVVGAAGYIAKSSGDEKVFERALATVFQEGIFLPASILRAAARPQWQRWPTPTTDLAQLGLSHRLAEVLYSLYQRLSNEHIASWMGICEGTVRKNYVSELLRLFNVTQRTELIIEISRLGIRTPPPEGRALAR